MSELKEAHKNKNIEAIDTALNTLNTAWQAASEEMYKATQEGQQGEQPPQGNPNAGETESPKDDEVTDVDFEEVDDK